MNAIRLMLVLLLLTGLAQKPRAQQVVDSTFYFNFYRIIEAYDNFGVYAFDFAETVHEMDSVTDLSSGKTVLYVAYKNWFSRQDSSFYTVQDDEFRATIQFQDSLIRIESPGSLLTEIAGIDLMQRDFIMSQVDSIRIAPEDTLTVMRLFFKPDSPFILYEMKFSTASFLIKQVDLSIKKGYYQTPANLADLDTIPEGYLSFQRVFSYTHYGVFQPEPYTAAFFYKENGKLRSTLPFEIVNSLED